MVFKRLLSRTLDVFPPFLALLAGLLVASLLLIALNANPIEAFQSLWNGAFGNENSTA